jgi:P27 family predicted phage terminase small subunit
VIVAGSKRGPAKTPTKLAVVKGERPDRLNKAEPQPAEPGGLEPPSWLSDAAKTMWRRLAPDLQRKGVLTAWDVDEFAAVCAHYVTWRTAQQLVDVEGPLVEGYRGAMVKNPAAQVARDAHAEFLRGASRFGMTPSDRTALSVGEEQRGGSEDLLTG